MDTAILERTGKTPGPGSDIGSGQRRELGSDEDGEAGRRQYRRRAEKLMALAARMALDDRLLLEQVYVHGMSMAALARLRRTQRQATARRVARLVRRMRSPLYGFLVGNADLFEPATRRIGLRVICQGYSLREAARQTDRSLHQVREAVRAVRIWARE